MEKALSPLDYRTIYEDARNYLLNFDCVNETLLNKYLDEWKNNAPESIEDLLEGMLGSVQNRQGMPNTIGKVENLKSYLCDFKPNQIIAEFHND